MTPAETVVAAIAANPKCSTGLLSRPAAFEIERGPSGGPELLALLFADERHLGYWYGHVRRHPTDASGSFVALTAFLKVFVNAPTVPLLFRRFDYWARLRLEYEPCTVQAPYDAFAVAPSYGAAAEALARIDPAIRLGEAIARRGVSLCP
ncbi:hypothetical protein GAY33_12040 [Azospirillum brasilense]|uniref:hypothetical protein n=1 Tax=Azospirillum argentinense TaxID=2970906 RepID=UPI00190DADFE|nr:hypothetical protein [Azospirillum argentinense]MBK3799955.1 hypothetical protein [Azospirillum argentinense]